MNYLANSRLALFNFGQMRRGDIAVVSELSQGLSFTVQLPANVEVK